MKRKDVITLVVIGVIASIFSYIGSGVIFTSSKQRSEKVPVVQKISSDFPAVQSDSQYQAFFNKEALNPTQLIKIGTSQNQTPFNSTP